MSKPVTIDGITYKISYLTGTFPFEPPKYSLEASDDGWVIACDSGVKIIGFSSPQEAIALAKSSGIHFEVMQ